MNADGSDLSTFVASAATINYIAVIHLDDVPDTTARPSLVQRTLWLGAVLTSLCQ
jgi:hypothetical protein